MKNLLARLLNRPRKGVLENIELTFGSLGQQIMTIDGVKYWTWIDYKKWPKIGQEIIHHPYTQRFHAFGSWETQRCTRILNE
jgi:hypothetical protein